MGRTHKKEDEAIDKHKETSEQEASTNDNGINQPHKYYYTPDANSLLQQASKKKNSNCIASKIWEPRITSITKAWEEIEILSVSDGLRDCCLVQDIYNHELLSLADRHPELSIFVSRLILQF